MSNIRYKITHKDKDLNKIDNFYDLPKDVDPNIYGMGLLVFLKMNPYTLKYTISEQTGWVEIHKHE